MTPSDIAQAQLNQITGGTSLVRSQDLKGSISNAADLLKGVPGVVAQEASGNGSELNLSIRGTGVALTGGPFGNNPKGVDLFVNGLPITSPAAYPFESVEPWFYDYTEVLRGGSADSGSLGALRLGGGINFVSLTGAQASLFETHNEFGSYGYRKDEVSTGQVIGNWDYAASFVDAYTDGFRQNSTSFANRAYVTAGYHFDSDLTTRFSFFYAEQDARNPQQLTLAQVESNPTQVNPKTVAPFNLWQRANGTYIAQDETKYQIDPDSSLNLNLQFKHQSAEFLYLLAPIANNNTSQKDETDDFASVLDYQRHDQIFGLTADTDISLNAQTILDGNREVIARAPSTLNGQVLTSQDLRGSNVTLNFNHDLEVFPNLWLSPGISLLYADRQAGQEGSPIGWAGQSYTDYAPRFGVRYDIQPDLQVYGDVARTVEFPQSTSYVTGLPTVANHFTPTTPGLESAGFHAQTATTAEVGFRGKSGIFSGSVDFYHSWVTDELLVQETAPGSGVYQTSNATPTTHQGVEFGLQTTLWQDDGLSAPDPKESDPKALSSGAANVPRTPSQLVLNNTLTWSDNHFVNDPAFGQNELPAIPQVSTYSELVFQHDSGFYIGPNVTWVPYKYAADYANTIYANSYALLGLKVGYKAPTGHWQVYVDLQNITNDHYVALVNATSNAHGVDTAVYWPGEVFNVTGGFEYKF
ncbi:MAG: TonB-dependent receptor [Methylacidiphilales bacterium]|nr:TonB-dependent receptor [Candidatus Methylacidiphilales bacterium]